METDRFISLIRPPVREFIDRVAADETRDVPDSIIVECEMIDSGNGKFGKEFSFDTHIVSHPSKNRHQHRYMDVFSDTAEEIVASVADDQGSKDSNVVIRNYLGEQARIRFSRTWMQMQLEEAFGGTGLSKEEIQIERSVLEALIDLIEMHLKRNFSDVETDEEDRSPAHG